MDQWHICTCLLRLQSVLSSSAWAVCSPYWWETYLQIAQVVKQREYYCNTWCFCRAAHLLQVFSPLCGWRELSACTLSSWWFWPWGPSLMTFFISFPPNSLGCFTLFFPQDFKWRPLVMPDFFPFSFFFFLEMISLENTGNAGAMVTAVLLCLIHYGQIFSDRCCTCEKLYYWHKEKSCLMVLSQSSTDWKRPKYNKTDKPQALIKCAVICSS